MDEHARLLLPHVPPLRFDPERELPPVPTLWDRAKALIGAVLQRVGSTAALSRRWIYPRSDRAELRRWLEPVEKLVRLCLIVEAMTWLVMTSQGRKLMRETPKMAIPEPRKPGKQIPHSVTIEYPGWQTIAKHWRESPPPPPPPPPQPDPYDPAHWACRFQVVQWREEKSDDWTPKKPPARSSRFVLDVWGDGEPVAGRIIKPERKEKPAERPALTMARRIEALVRVIANPAPAIARLARFIARLPHEVLEASDPWRALSRLWRHGRQEFFDAAEHGRKIFAVYHRLLEAG